MSAAKPRKAWYNRDTKCAWCDKRIRSNQTRACPYQYGKFPFWAHFLRLNRGTDGRGVNDFDIHCSLCTVCNCKVMKPKLQNKIPANVQKMLDESRAEGDYHTYRYRTELQKLIDDQAYFK